MSFPQTPLPIQGEIFVAGSGWVDVTGDIRQSGARSGGGIEIARGLRDEASSADPGTCSFVLNNRMGKYSPRNPLSEYYGHIGRNTPFRLSESFLSDDFNRADQSGLGTSAEGWSWTINTGWAIESGLAVASFTSDNQIRRIWVDGNETQDSDVLVTLFQDAWIEGAALVTGVVTRYQDGQNYVWFQLAFEPGPDYKLTLKIVREVNNVYEELATLTEIPGNLVDEGQLLYMRASTSGTNLAVKVWSDAQLEPPDWQLQVSDDSLLLPGQTAITAWLLAGNTNDPRPQVYFDNLVIRLPVFHGEISSWPTRWDLSGNDQWTPVTASGVLRRLGQGKKPISSPIFRNLSRYQPTGYWSMEDGRDSVYPASSVAGQSSGFASEVSFGSDDTLAGATTVARLDSDSSLIRLTNRPATDNTSWSFITFFKLDSAPSSEATLLEITSSGTVTTWRFSIDSVNYRWTALDSSDSTVFTSAGNFALAPPTGWMALHLEVTQAGSDVEFRTHWHSVGDSTFYNPASIPEVYPGSIGNPSRVQFGPTSLAPASIGHVAFYGNDIPVEISSEFRAASNGHIGETAGNRLLRLAAEEGISVGVAGDPDQTEPMGRQRARSFLELIEECAAADGGLLYENRMSLGLTYRTRSSLYNRQGVELSYADGQVAEPFEPIEDDANIRNDVTVSRESGSSSRFALESGPLSIQAPPDGVGPYEESVILNLHEDSQTANQAAWRVHQGTVDEARYPTVSVNLAAPGLSDAVLARKVAALDSGDFLSVTDTPDWLPPGPTPMMLRGYSQHLDAYDRTITFNAVPASAWLLGVASADPADTDGSTLVDAVDSNDTEWSVASDGEPWTTDPTHWPFELIMGGEVVSATEVVGSSSPQTITVVRSTNGITKSHAAGTPIRVNRPLRYAL